MNQLIDRRKRRLAQFLAGRTMQDRLRYLHDRLPNQVYSLLSLPDRYQLRMVIYRRPILVGTNHPTAGKKKKRLINDSTWPEFWVSNSKNN